MPVTGSRWYMTRIKKDDTAAIWYEKADSLYDAATQGDYDMVYLEFLRNSGLFYAENNNAAKRA